MQMMEKLGKSITKVLQIHQMRGSVISIKRAKSLPWPHLPCARAIMSAPATMATETHLGRVPEQSIKPGGDQLLVLSNQVLPASLHMAYISLLTATDSGHPPHFIRHAIVSPTLLFFTIMDLDETLSAPLLSGHGR